jgi:metallophosphoesterase superfamily enzyme
LRGRHFRRRCFVSDGARAVLPAFGAYAGGLDLSDAAFRGLFSRTPEIWLIGRKRVHALGRFAYA